ncbi:MAG: hypothetical protein KBF93_26895 [Leptospiraceae bacterium]|nr:hypothetical protein [Leptospiraceae bacterium]
MQYTFQLLRILKSNLEKMQTLLSYGDGESAVKISFQNERILSLLEKYKEPSAKSDVALQTLVNACLILQEDCDKKLQSITSEYKKELNTHMIKRQILEHLENVNSI